MQILRDSLIQIVSQHSEDDEALLKEVECLVQSKGERVLPILLHLFTHLEFDDRESKQIWEDILQNHRNLNSTLGREVKLITSICDYFLSIRKSFTNPKVVELQLFEEANHNSKCDGHPLVGLLAGHGLGRQEPRLLQVAPPRLSSEIPRSVRADRGIFSCIGVTRASQITLITCDTAWRGCVVGLGSV